MALKLATAQRPPKRRTPSTPPPKQEHTSKVNFVQIVTDEDLDAEKIFDPNEGRLVVKPERVHNKYPSCDSTTRVAKCVVCEKVKDKADMMCLGQNHHEKGSLRYVWRCAARYDNNGRQNREGCEAGSKSWLKHYKHKSKFGNLWNYNIAENKRIKHSDEETVAVGRQIVQKVQDKIDADLVKALSKIKEKRVKTNREKFIEEFAQKKKAVVDALKKGAEKHGAKSVRVEVKPERRAVVATRTKEVKDVEVRSAVVPRWKRKGRDARVRRR